MQPKSRIATEMKAICSQSTAQLPKEEKALKAVHKQLYRKGIREYAARNEEATAAM